MKRKFLAAGLVLILILSSSCKKETADTNTSSGEVSSSAEQLSVAKITSDSLNPFTLKTNTNRQLLGLCFDGLYRINAAFTPEPVIAESFTANGNTYTFSLRSGAKFTDGAKVTAGDVVYSYQLAKNNVSAYNSRFSYITSIYENSGKVVIMFSAASDRNLNLLDIPVIKKGSETNAIPTGSGRYILTEENGQYKLTANKNWFMSPKPSIPEIKVSEVPDIDTLFHGFNTGQITAAYADLLNVSKTYLGTIDLSTFATNNLFFLGFNYTKPWFASNKVRQGISSAVNRANLVSEVLLTYGLPVWHPFNPSWTAVSSLDIPADIYSKETAAADLNEGGITAGSDGTRTLNGQALNLSLLVCSDNAFKTNAAEQIKEDLNKVGIAVTLKSLPADQYTAALNVKDFDLFLGEVKVPQNMDITVFARPEINKGGWNGQLFFDILNGIDTKTFGIDGAVTKFNDETPIVPLFYKKSALAVTRSLTGNIIPSDSDMFYGIENCVMK